MRKILIFLLGVAVCANVAMASYSYSVGGKVYYSGSGLPVPKGTPVTFTANFTSGGSVQNTVYTAIDGSFSVSHALGNTNPVGASMTLKAVTGLCSGSKNWVCNGSNETKDVWVFCSIQPNPNLSVTTMPLHFVTAGLQPPVTTIAFLDQPSGPVLVQQFQVKLAWNAAQMNAVNVQPSLGSQFEILSWFSAPGSGELFVSGVAMAAPVPLQIVPESFFDVFFDVIAPPEELPAFATVTVVPEETQLSNGMGLYYYPYQHQADYLIGEPEKCQPTFMINSLLEWKEARQGELPNPNIRPMPAAAWEQYMAYWIDPLTEKQGQPYPETTFVPCAEPSGMLYVWPGGGGVEGPGLVMAWGVDEQQEGNYASAWRYDYGMDPDLSNCTIQVTVTPPGPHINAVSFSIVDIANRMRTWWWSVPAAIPLGVSTTVKINTAIAGIGAATPAATGYMNVPGFDITQSQFFDVDENFQYIFQQFPVPPPGQPNFVGSWNYWHNLIVTKNTVAKKWFYIKYSQKPYVMDAAQPPQIFGWDEKSVYQPQPIVPNPIMADDWPCNDPRPITDIHWWGSFIGWTQPHLPSVVPTAFHIGIWTDVPDPDPANPQDYSHPGKLIWENTCTNWVWNFAGYDVDPRIEPMQDEACFQFTQLLSENEWFYQKPEENQIYWLSIAAIYSPQDWQNIQYPWGWKTRPHQFSDDAVRIQGATTWPVAIGAVYNAGVPIQLPAWPDPQGVSWDLAFELSTNEPKAPASADLDYSGFVDLADFAIFATQWLTAQP
jgi:hypothetical protein